jgi:hypothetical protein
MAGGADADKPWIFHRETKTGSEQVNWQTAPINLL